MFNKSVLADEGVESSDLRGNENKTNFITTKFGVLRPFIEGNDEVPQFGIVCQARRNDMIEIMNDNRKRFLVDEVQPRKIVEYRKCRPRFFRRILRVICLVIGIVATQGAKIRLALFAIGKLNATLRVVFGDSIVVRENFAAQSLAQCAEFAR